ELLVSFIGAMAMGGALGFWFGVVVGAVAGVISGVIFAIVALILQPIHYYQLTMLVIGGVVTGGVSHWVFTQLFPMLTEGGVWALVFLPTLIATGAGSWIGWRVSATYLDYKAILTSGDSA